MKICTNLSRRFGEWKASGSIPKLPCPKMKDMPRKLFATPFVSLTTDTKSDCFGSRTLNSQTKLKDLSIPSIGHLLFQIEHQLPALVLVVVCNLLICDLPYLLKVTSKKTSLPQRNFHIAKATRLFSRIYKALDEENVGFDISSLNDELKKILTDVENQFHQNP